jgi:hypothetical protein
MTVYEQVSANGRESGVLNLYSQLAGRGGRMGNGRGGCVRVKSESGSDRNVRGGKKRDGSPGNLGCSEEGE